MIDLAVISSQIVPPHWPIRRLLELPLNFFNVGPLRRRPAGDLVLCCCVRSLCSESSAFDAFWALPSPTVACLQLYQFFRPVDAILADLLCLVAICGVIFNREVFMAILRRAVGYGFLRTGLVLTPILVIAVRCAGPVVHYDTGFYGSMAVRWLTRTLWSPASPTFLTDSA